MNVRDAAVADLGVVATLHAAAFAGEIGPLAGRGYMTAFLRWFIETPGSVALVAEEQGRILGYVLGAPNGYGPGQTRDLLPVIIEGVVRNLPRIVAHPSFRRQIRFRAANLLLRRDPRSTIHEATPRDVYCLVGIGTDAASRGRGVGKALVRALCGRSGGRAVILDVFKDNTAARALYVHCGFRILVEEGRVVRMIFGTGQPEA